MKKSILLGVALFLTTVSSNADFISAGRSLSPARSSRFSVQIGSVSKVDGLVEETTRKLYDVLGESWKQDTAESFALRDFGFDDDYFAFGVEYEKGGKYFSFMFDATVLDVSAESVALRNYYIGIDKAIEYQGKTYKNLKIPEGSEFSMDVTAVFSDLRLLITPFTFKFSDYVRFTPWATLSVGLLAGQYDLYAGIPIGTAIYLNPPEVYVVGGSSKGILGLGVPEIGGGGELRIGKGDGFELVLQGNYSMCSYDGSTSFLTSSKHREKNADIDHKNILARAMLEFPFGNGKAFTIGAQYQKVDTSASITSKGVTEEEILAKRERFDKNAEFYFESAMLLAGISF